MGWQTYATLGVTGLVLAALVRDVAPDLVFLTALVVLTLLGVITPEEGFAGFSNDAVLTVGALFVVVAALNETGVMSYAGERVLGRARDEGQALVRLALALVPASAFLNNTPIVAMTVPAVLQWCRRRSVSLSRLLLPVSYFTILGGTCSLIGTSTNLVVQGLMRGVGLRPMGLLEIGFVGLPCALVGTAHRLLGRRLMPDRKELIEQLGDARREYLAEMLVQPGARLVGKSVPTRCSRPATGWCSWESSRRSSTWSASRGSCPRRTCSTRSRRRGGMAGGSARRWSAGRRRSWGGRSARPISARSTTPRSLPSTAAATA